MKGKKILKRILIILGILLFIGSFLSSMQMKPDGTWYLEQHMRRSSYPSINYK